MEKGALRTGWAGVINSVENIVAESPELLWLCVSQLPGWKGQ